MVTNLDILQALKRIAKGGEGSGHFDHEGRPGEVGGSAPGGGGGEGGGNYIRISGSAVNATELRTKIDKHVLQERGEAKIINKERKIATGMVNITSVEHEPIPDILNDLQLRYAARSYDAEDKPTSKWIVVAPSSYSNMINAVAGKDAFIIQFGPHPNKESN